MSVQARVNPWDLLSGCETLDIATLANATQKTFDCLSHWYELNNEGKSPRAVAKNRKNIVKQSEVYFDAITLSIGMARAGKGFAEEASAYIEQLLAASASPAELRQSLNAMQQLARKGAVQAGKTEEKFRKVRVNLLKVSREAQVSLVAVVQPGGVEAANSTAESKPSKSRTLTRSQKFYTTADAQAELERAITDLDALTKSASNFANWWTEMATNLETIKSVTPTNPSDVGKSITRRWNDIGIQYGQYVKQIQVIEDIRKSLPAVMRASGGGCIIC